MVYHGHGFTWTELYNMPTWLRKFYLKKMEEAKKEEKKLQEEANKSGRKGSSSKTTPRPNIPRVSRK